MALEQETDVKKVVADIERRYKELISEDCDPKAVYCGMELLLVLSQISDAAAVPLPPMPKHLETNEERLEWLNKQDIKWPTEVTTGLSLEWNGSDDWGYHVV